MSTIEKLDKISEELYNKSYNNCSKENRDVVFKIFLDKYAIKFYSRN